MMTWLGVPVLDWVILVAVLALGTEAWISCRPAKRQPPAPPSGAGRDPDPEG
jgi:hypothetical protein